MRGALIYLARLSVMHFRCCHITSAGVFFIIYLLSYYKLYLHLQRERDPPHTFCDVMRFIAEENLFLTLRVNIVVDKASVHKLEE